ncbi:MAG: PaaI family thioesterase [Proteobacteria bacterium]|nr:PaaI family thioesterase [Pseudomonadota bacterium]MDA1059508.1 PaaI family thioesterase [Pseudomonadota bacterium]
MDGHAGTDQPDVAGAEPPPGFFLIDKRSAFGVLVGPVFQHDDAAGNLYGFRVQAKHLNLGGVAHGGMLATFADVVLGQFPSRDFGRLTVTIRLVMDYLAPAKAGDWVEARPVITRETRNLVFAETTLVAGPRSLLTASAIFKTLERRRTKPTQASQSGDA